MTIAKWARERRTNEGRSGGSEEGAKKRKGFRAGAGRVDDVIRAPRGRRRRTVDDENINSPREIEEVKENRKWNSELEFSERISH